jgi:hypothetical protein
MRCRSDQGGCHSKECTCTIFKEPHPRCSASFAVPRTLQCNRARPRMGYGADYFLMTVEDKSYGARRAVGRIPVVQLCFKIVYERGFWWLLTIRTKSSRSGGGGAHKTPRNFSRRPLTKKARDQVLSSAIQMQSSPTILSRKRYWISRRIRDRSSVP